MTIKQQYKNNRSGLTLLEMLLVVSFIGMISVSLYSALVNGLKVWKKSQELVVEEDVALFFDRITRDVHNTFPFSKINFEGSEYKFSFPTMITTLTNKENSFTEQEYTYQLGKVEYYYDFIDNGMYMRRANYSQAVNSRFEEPRLLISGINRVRFRYYYLTEDGETISDSVLDTFPSGIEIEIEFSDSENNRKMQKFINVPIKS